MGIKSIINHMNTPNNIFESLQPITPGRVDPRPIAKNFFIEQRYGQGSNGSMSTTIDILQIIIMAGFTITCVVLFIWFFRGLYGKPQTSGLSTKTPPATLPPTPPATPV